MKNPVRRINLFFWWLLAVSCLLINVGQAEPVDDIKPDERCPVCGMFVAKYEVWITEIRIGESDVLSFDGVKDMMAYYFNPKAYNGPEQSQISEIWVKDYYSLKWLEGRKAFYVIGSDVHGPMGHELIPFSSKAAAESFLGDHHGRMVLSFDGITEDMIEELRAGSRMKKMN